MKIATLTRELLGTQKDEKNFLNNETIKYC